MFLSQHYRECKGKNIQNPVMLCATRSPCVAGDARGHSARPGAPRNRRENDRRTQANRRSLATGGEKCELEYN